MSDEHGVNYHYRDNSGWFVGVIVSLAIMAIGYLVFTYNADQQDDPQVTEQQAACMIANPGMNCEQVTRWEPVKPKDAA